MFNERSERTLVVENFPFDFTIRRDKVSGPVTVAVFAVVAVAAVAAADTVAVVVVPETSNNSEYW